MTDHRIVESANAAMNGLSVQACRDATLNLLSEIRTFLTGYVMDYGRRPDVAVVLASTDLVAAVVVAARMRDTNNFIWHYDAETGQLTYAAHPGHILLCEYPDLEPWACSITAPGEATLGRPRVHRAVIGATR